MNLVRSCSLAEARAAIEERCRALPSETLSLSEALGRVTARECLARCAVPGYDQATRDGYIVGGEGVGRGDGPVSFRVVGELPAGSEPPESVRPGEAYRIMTGAMTPPGGGRVLMQEDCLLRGNMIEVSARALADSRRFVQQSGAVVAAGSVVVAAGTMLEPGHLAMLAATGNAAVAVHDRPRVAFVCSGSELVEIGVPVAAGKKISANKYLLAGLVRRYGGIPLDCGIVCDDLGKMRGRLEQMMSEPADILISTGGVGPGKYDLFGRLLEEAGARLLYRSLALSPGKATLCATLRGKLYFGLPGPPPAVTVLFRELIAPLLRKMQGMVCYRNREVSARLEHELPGGGRNITRILEGVARVIEGEVWVRRCERYETATCHIHLPPGTEAMPAGAGVTVSVAGEVPLSVLF